MGLKKTAKSKGMGGFLQVGRLTAEFPGIKGFFAIVTAVKPVPPTVDNASCIIVLDETPLSDCNEVALNQSNTNRVIRFLETEMGGDNESLLVDCVMHFRLKRYANHATAGVSEYGLEISEIEPPEGHKTAKPMKFESFTPPVSVPPVEDPAEELRRKRREAIQKRIAATAEPESPAATKEAKRGKTGH